MTKNILLICCCTIIGLCSFAQNGGIKGVITDTAARKNLYYAIVALLDKKDSSLVNSTRSDAGGNFLLEEIKPGNYTLLVTFPRMADYLQEVTIADGSKAEMSKTTAGKTEMGRADAGMTDVGKIMMTSRFKLLEEFTVRQKVAAIRMKGDTLEYKADSFAVRPNANVEELLRRLPGIQVDRNGNITAQGEKVTKVFVDGDEFFSDDPTLATRYLEAHSVDKIQVYDRKSDQANFTGIDDGKHAKTINIQLKEDKKKGYFGKLSTGSNGKDFYNHEAMANDFMGKQKISVFGIASSTGETGLSGQDRQQYLPPDYEMIDDGSGRMMNSSNEEYESDRYYGSGLPDSRYAGGQYVNKWGDNKEKLSANYRFNQLNTRNTSTNNSLEVRDTLHLLNSGYSNTTTHNREHKAIANYEMKLDSFSSIKVTADGKYQEGVNGESGYSESKRTDGVYLNQSQQYENGGGSNQRFNSDLLWRHKFREKGRTLSVEIQQHYSHYINNKQTAAYQVWFDSVTHLPNPDTVIQEQNIIDRTQVLGAKIGYTHPLSKRLFLQADYSWIRTNSERDRATLDRFHSPIDSLSNDYAFRVSSHMGNMVFRLVRKKVNFFAGGGLVFTNFQQTDLASKAVYLRPYVNFFPQAGITLNPKLNQNITFRYDGKTEQPTIDQLQPLRDNSNPLWVYVGNPSLGPQFRHTFSLNFNDYKMATSSNIYGNLNWQILQHAISSNSTIDAYNKTTYQNINLNGGSAINGYLGYNRDLRKIHLQTGGNLNANYNNSYFIQNDRKYMNANTSVSGDINISYYKDSLFSVGVRSDIRYSYGHSTVGSAGTGTMWTYTENLSTTWFLPWKMELSSDCNFDIQPRNAAFHTGQNIIKWNGGLTKRVFKNERGAIKLSVVNILNQNTGYSRYASGNVISTNTNTYIPRYGLLSFTWNFSHTGK
ncbi:MAG TPA: TonB-dependent receptor [Puia sp.]|nr:TonB-dependent receptor [Puia sp.]